MTVPILLSANEKGRDPSTRASWMPMIPEIRDRKTEPIACFELIASFVIFLLGLTSTIAASVTSQPADMAPAYLRYLTPFSRDTTTLFPGTNIAIPFIRIIGGSTGLCMSSMRSVGDRRRYFHRIARASTQVIFTVLFATGLIRAGAALGQPSFYFMFGYGPMGNLIGICELCICCISGAIVITSAYSFYRSVRVQREKVESTKVINVEEAAPVDSKDTESVIPIESNHSSMNGEQPPVIFELIESCIVLTLGVISTAVVSYRYSEGPYYHQDVAPGVNIAIPLVGIIMYASNGLIAASKSLNTAARESLRGFHRIMCVLNPLLFTSLFGCAVARSMYYACVDVVVLCEISICCISAKIVIASSVSAYRIIRTWRIHDTPSGDDAIKSVNPVTPPNGAVPSVGSPRSDEQKAIEINEQPIAVTESSNVLTKVNLPQATAHISNQFQKLLYPAIPPMDATSEGANKPPGDPTAQSQCTEEIVQ